MVFQRAWRQFQLNAEAAWSITTSSSNIIIAIIDTGVLTSYPDLAANLWTNPNVAEDATNGYPGDIHGWDFYNNGSDPDPDLGDGSGDGNVFHGRSVAGMTAAVVGTARDRGVAPQRRHGGHRPPLQGRRPALEINLDRALSRNDSIAAKQSEALTV